MNICRCHECSVRPPQIGVHDAELMELEAAVRALQAAAAEMKQAEAVAAERSG